jgi:hypothetical protein
MGGLGEKRLDKDGFEWLRLSMEIRVAGYCMKGDRWLRRAMAFS